MDGLSVDERYSPKNGEDFNVESHTHLGDGNWNGVFQGDPKKLIGLKNTEEWEY